ncbi:MAG: hypothetical protein ACR2FY_06265 [Pirellulaceae bacterium]
MTFVLGTLAILCMLAINRAVHGFGCWGYQPGGPISGMLFDLQATLSLAAFTWLIYRVYVAKDTGRLIAFALALATTLAAMVAYQTTGSQLHTSIHGQGPENLPTFFLVSAVSLVIGIYRWKIVGPDLSKWRLKFSIRDIMLVTMIVALGVGWALDHRQLAEKIKALTPHARNYPAGHPLGPPGRTIPPQVIPKEDDPPDPFADPPKP